ncbi:NADPH dehydrogenase NamA [Clostridium gasigenes]|uniref:NADPH dehydrogenase NamA n=1 Tax=Clostridium gasigenes TaxID=94869 RepID=UPI00162A0F1B|nr:NADPH dehydrogenase NamA [Clostridium gasigenes]MBB6622904.1 NADPH dehydrogenase NamA [Clostridium gasigenes]
MKGIFKELKVKNLIFRNRIVMAPMCMYCADSEGYANDFHEIHYTARAIGGVGAIIIEATGVETRGRISNRDLGIWDDSHIEGLRKISDSIKKYGAVSGIQLGHAGRKCSVLSEDVIGPSAIHFNEEEKTLKTPREMTKKDIAEVAEKFKNAAKRADDAGFDFIEIHGAHGYLISEFLSPLSNKRNDEYGGNIENRVRLLKEVILKVKEVWPNDKAIMLRVSAEDYEKGGNTKEDMAKIILLVKDLGIDIVDISTGAVVPAKINIYPGYQIPAGEYIKNNANIKVIVGGLITTGNEGTEIIESKRGDLVYIGRELLRDPNWVLNQAKNTGIKLEYLPKQYERGF